MANLDGLVVSLRSSHARTGSADTPVPDGTRPPAWPRERQHRAVAGHARIRGTASVGESAAHACEAEQSNRAWDVSRFNSAWLSEADFRRVAARLLGRALVFGREETTRFRAVAGSHRIGRASHVRSLRQG